jgi:hypothetical protein
MDLNIELIARVVHQANRVMQLQAGEEELSPEWDKAPEWQKESAIKGIAVALAGPSAAQMHEAWMNDKIADGWVYGEVKDAEKKTHPCLVPYLKLPPEQRMKDYMFREIVLAFKTYADVQKQLKECWACSELDHGIHANCFVCGRGI